MKKKLYISIVFVLIVISILPLILKMRTRAVFPQQSYCNVNFQRPIYEFKSPNGDSVFVLDENGNLYLNGTKVLFNQKSGIPQPDHGFGLMVNSNFYWAFNNTNVNIYGEILQEQTLPTVAGQNDILFRNPVSKEPLAFFDGNSGDLSIKGLVIYNGYYEGMSVDKNAFNSNCTTTDNYNSSTGTDYWQDYYCNRIDCVYRNIDLDSSQQLCEGNHHNWGIGGNADPTTCCGDDPNEFNLTRQCNSGCCTSDSTDNACCDDSNDAVNGSNCFTEGSKICSPDNSKYVIEANSGKWTFNEDCSTHCKNSCTYYTSCSNGNCIGDNYVSTGNICVEDGTQTSGLCNSNWACSNLSNSMIYNDGGNLSCQATCGNNGECNHATNCIDCSQQGSINGCACACGGYGQEESSSNTGTCDDGIDNDCDGKADNLDPDCCLDADNDGWGTPETYLSCGNNSAPDCNDDDPNVNPAEAEQCNGIDDDCDSEIDEENASGCTTYYYDYDNDGYGTTNSKCLCSASGYYRTTNSGDCYDLNIDANPGQNNYFDHDRGDGSYDYDCDSSIEKSDCTYYTCNAVSLRYGDSSCTSHITTYWSPNKHTADCGDSKLTYSNGDRGTVYYTSGSGCLSTTGDRSCSSSGTIHCVCR